MAYSSFDYLDPATDYKTFDLAAEPDRVPGYTLPLTDEEEIRLATLQSMLMITFHEHLGIFPADVDQTPDYVREGRMATAFEGLRQSRWTAGFDNLLNGLCQIHSKSGWKWTEVIHDLGMRLCDIAHQDHVFHAKSVADIEAAFRDGRFAWIASMEGAAMIENELDRIDVLYGLGVRCLGVTYSESNALGSGLKEARDGGLTSFGRKAVKRMNQVGMLIDCSHAGDQTTLDTVAESQKPVVLTHIGARALWNTNRMAPDDVIKAIAGSGGVIGIEAAPHTTLTANHRRHGLDAVMEHFEYVKDLVGIDHVAFGPDATYGDHVGLHRVYGSSLSIKESHSRDASGPGEYEMVEYVEGLENPTEASYNLPRWLVKHEYSDEDIRKVMGGNILRVLKDVWV